jgi:radical SAM superfamily enzyme YgiQ (UPF0313 family)
LGEPEEENEKRKDFIHHSANRNSAQKQFPERKPVRHHQLISELDRHEPRAAAASRFQPIAGIDVLEYPTWEEYRNALRRGYDVVGISFFTWTAPEAMAMAQEAKRFGAGEVWGGNYGIMTPGVKDHFDRVFSGNCEAEVSRMLTGSQPEAIRHPAIIGKASWAGFGENIGYLYTKRGCKSGCSFCPTPWFTAEDSPSSISGTKEVLDAYASAQASPVIIFDETFLDNSELSERVMEELSRRHLRWVCLTRADRIVGKVSALKKKGLHSAIIGVESVRDGNLNFVKKRVNSALVREVIDELRAHGCFPCGTYMLGFPDDTEESIREDILELSSWGFFLMQFTILTPYPGTPLWSQLKDKIIDWDWRHYDSYNLVWDHPHLSPGKARDLLYHALRTVNRPSNYLRKTIGYYVMNRFAGSSPQTGPAGQAETM